MNETISLGSTNLMYPTPSPRLRVQHHQIPPTPRLRATTPCALTLDNISLRDNAKILQLAERIQTKKSPTKQVKASSNQHLLSTPAVAKPVIKNAKITVFGDGGKSKRQQQEQQRKSKLYSSFSSGNKKFQDPTRTNIEHLVNIAKSPTNVSSTHAQQVYPGRDSPSPVPITPSFHDSPKLASIFGNNTGGRRNGSRVTVTIGNSNSNGYAKIGNGVVFAHAQVHERSVTPPLPVPSENANAIIVEDLNNCQDILSRLSVNVVNELETKKCVSKNTTDGRNHVTTVVVCPTPPNTKYHPIRGNSTLAPNGGNNGNFPFSSHYWSDRSESSEVSVSHCAGHGHDASATSQGMNISSAQILPLPRPSQCPPTVERSGGKPHGRNNHDGNSKEWIPVTVNMNVKPSHDYSFSVRKSKSELQVNLSCGGSGGACPSPEQDSLPYYHEERKRSNSFPSERKQFFSQNVLPSLLDRDEMERLEHRRSSFFQSTDALSPLRIGNGVTRSNKIRPGPGSENANAAETSNSSSSSSRRPLSIDVSQKKQWMQVYRDIEVNSHAHAQAQVPNGNGVLRLAETIKSPAERSGTPEPKTLFQRFSKTFSLRFSPAKKKQQQQQILPDVRSKVDRDRDRTDSSSSKVKNPQIRTDKCSSGDSGIQLMDEPPMRRDTRIRRSRGNTNGGGHDMPSPPGELSLSLVEFPNHVWDPNSKDPHHDEPSPVQTDDGFASTDDLSSVATDSQKSVSPNTNTSANTNTNANYHSLPLKYSRQRKAALLEKHAQVDAEPIRAKVVREIVTTEQSYVKTLHDIIQGFLLPCRNEDSLFSEQVITSIFSNIEELFKFHIKFLDNLMDSIDHGDWSQSRVGSVFTIWVAQFDLYSDYCISNPMSMATVRRLMQNPLYDKFFEACRRLQLMDKLPLHGFLLRPIQRICQYHLQLNELLKNTETTHPDYSSVVSALNAMKTVAMRVNDTQREFERLQEIVRFQSTIEGWEGPDLVNRNAVTLRAGDLVKMSEGERHREVHVVLLNRDIVICKRDSFRKNVLSYNLRIDLESSVWVNIDSNEEDDYFGMVHNSWRIYNPAKSSWILFTCASPTEKRAWINALEGTAQKFAYDAKIVEMAKTTAELVETKDMTSPAVNGMMIRGKKMRKSNTKLDSDAMLIEVGKLKQRPIAGSSKFYV